MSEDIVIRILLFPLALLYGLGVGLRNLLYRVGILRSVRFDLPVISVGNLSVGGAGKSPHIEYLIRWLDQFLDVSVLSRGYGRNTSGYRPVTVIDTAEMVGDEPLQFKRKFPTVPICVSESRALGVPELVKRNPETQVVLLDDAFQHRALKPGVNILLTDQALLYVDDFLVPSGYLREYASASQRADMIIVSKCKPNMSVEERTAIKNKLAILPQQRLYFSYIKYGKLMPYFGASALVQTDTAVAFAGIANTSSFEEYLKNKFEQVTVKTFADHHAISELEIDKLLAQFNEHASANKILVSTEKDYQKLVQSPFAEKLKSYPFYYLPIEIAFFEEDESAFNQQIMDYVKQNCTNT
jgi:tetraacyldisaccharide 4'-kinase